MNTLPHREGGGGVSLLCSEQESPGNVCIQFVHVSVTKVVIHCHMHQ